MRILLPITNVEEPSITTLDPQKIIDDIFKTRNGTSQQVYIFGSNNGSDTTDEADRRFKNRYRGSKIKYTAIVDKLLPDENAILFKGGGFLVLGWKVKGTFPAEDADKFSTIAKGETLSIVGVVESFKVTLLGNLIQVRITSAFDTKLLVMSVN